MLEYVCRFRLLDAPSFISAQLAGALAATGFVSLAVAGSSSSRGLNVLLPHNTGTGTDMLKTYMFACVQNAGRSQMAAAFFNMYADAGCRAISAGTAPAENVHPLVVDVMREIGIDLAAAKPQKLTEELVHEANVLVTMGCGESCPFVSGLKIIEWSLPDPKRQPIEAVRAIRDQIHEYVKALLRDDCRECCSSLR